MLRWYLDLWQAGSLGQTLALTPPRSPSSQPMQMFTNLFHPPEHHVEISQKGIIIPTCRASVPLARQTEVYGTNKSKVVLVFSGTGLGLWLLINSPGSAHLLEFAPYVWLTGRYRCDVMEDAFHPTHESISWFSPSHILNIWLYLPGIASAKFSPVISLCESRRVQQPEFLRRLYFELLLQTTADRMAPRE